MLLSYSGINSGKIKTLFSDEQVPHKQPHNTLMLQTPVSILVGFSAVHHVLGAMDNNNNKENTLTSNYVCKFRNSFIGTLFPDTKQRWISQSSYEPEYTVVINMCSTSGAVFMN